MVRWFSVGSEMKTELVTVIGGGPAGLAASLQLELYGISPLVIERSETGGLLLNASCVVNYPGVPEGLSGRELVSRFPKPSRLIKDEVISLSRETQGRYRIQLSGGTFFSETVIVASGTIPEQIPLPGVTKDRIFYDVKNIDQEGYTSAAVVGGGDAALDYAVTLSRALEVTVYARGTFSRAVPHLCEKVDKIKAITLQENCDFPREYHQDIIVVACGRKPEVGFLSEDLLCSPPEDRSFHMCGDCARGILRQTAIAVGDGTKAAMLAAAFLSREQNGKA